MRSIGSAATIAPKMIVVAKQSYLGDATVGIENNQRVDTLQGRMQDFGEVGGPT